MEELSLDMDDAELEEKLDAMIKADIISHGQSLFDYGVASTIFSTRCSETNYSVISVILLRH